MKKIRMKKIKCKKVSDFASSLMKCHKLFKFVAQKLRFPKYQKNQFLFAGVDFFYFSIFGWEKQGSISGNTRNAFFSENITMLGSVQIRSYFWSAFFCIRTKYGTLFHSVQKNLSRKSSSLRKYKKFFNIRARKFHFRKNKEFLLAFWGWIFFFFWGDWEVR